MQLNIRQYILEKTEVQADMQDVGEFLVDELTYAYNIFQKLLKHTYKFGIVKQRGQIDDIILNNLLSYHDPKTGPQVVSALKRLEVEAKTKLPEAINWKVVKTYAFLIVNILAAIAGAFKFIKPHYDRMKSNKVMAANKEYIRRIYDTAYLPGLRTIYSNIMDKNIKNESQLKLAFYKVVDKIISQYPSLRAFIMLWNVPA